MVALVVLGGAGAWFVTQRDDPSSDDGNTPPPPSAQEEAETDRKSELVEFCSGSERTAIPDAPGAPAGKAAPVYVSVEEHPELRADWAYLAGTIALDPAATQVDSTGLEGLDVSVVVCVRIATTEVTAQACDYTDADRTKARSFPLRSVTYQAEAYELKTARLLAEGAFTPVPDCPGHVRGYEGTEAVGLAASRTDVADWLRAHFPGGVPG